MATAKVRLGVAFDGEKDVKQAITNINAHMKTLKSEAELVATTFKNQANSEEALAAKSKVLSEQLEIQSKKYELIKEAVEKAKSHQNDWAEAIDKTKGAISDQIDKIEKLSKEYGDSSTEVKQAEDALNKLQTTLEKQENSYQKAANNTEKWQTSLNKAAKDVKETENQLESCEKDLDNFGDEAKDTANDVEKLDKASSGVGEKISSMGVAFGTFIGNIATEALNAAVDKVKEFASSVVDLGSTFEASMSNVQGLSGATAEEMEQLEAKAREMGKSTVFSASEASDALGYMALAGWDTSQMLDGLDGVLKLAAAGGSDLATTSDIVTDNLSAFGMAASDATKFADTMAYAMSTSNTTTEALGEAYSKCAATAKASGVSFEETSAALMVLANSGIKGSEAGTSLNAIMARLTSSNKNVKAALKELNVSVYDSEGKMRSLSDILIDVNNATQGMTDKQKNLYIQQLSGVNHLSKFNTLLAGVSKEADASGTSIASYTEQLKGCAGTAQELSDTMNDNLKGDLATLNSAWEDFQLTIYDTQKGALRGLVQTVTNEVIPALNGMVTGAEGAGQQLLTSLTDIGKQAGDMAGNIVSQFFGEKAGNSIKSLMDTLMTSLEKIFPLLEQLGEPIGRVIEAVSEIINTLLPPIIDIVSDIIETLTPAIDMVCNIAETLSKIIKPVLEGIEFILKPIFEMIGWISSGISAIADFAGAAIDGLGWFLSGCPQVCDNFEEVIAKSEEVQKATQGNIDKWNEFLDAQGKKTGDTIGALQNCDLLKEELDGIVDKNGKVIEGYEARAQWIANQLTETTGVEVKIVDGVIQKYDQLSKSIEKAIKEKEIAALQEYYDNILAQYSDGANQLYYDLEQTENRIGSLNEAMKNTSPNTDEYKELASQLEEAQKQYNGLKEQIRVYATVSSESQALYVAQVKGDNETINQLLQNRTHVVETENGQIVESTEQVMKSNEAALKAYKEQLAERQKAGDEAGVKAIQTQIDALEKQNQQQEDAQNKSTQKLISFLSGSSKLWSDMYSGVLEQAKESVKNMDKDEAKPAKKFLKNIEDELKNGKITTAEAVTQLTKYFNISDELGNYGTNAGSTFKDNLVAELRAAETAAAAVVPGIGAAIAGALEIKSPSRLMKRLGKFTGEGFKIGVVDSMGDAVDAVQNKSNELIHTTTAGLLRLNRAVSSSNTASANRSNGQMLYLDSMNKKLSDLTSGVQNVYNIDGITYDDGSGVAMAINSLVRAAKIQRRA